MAIVTVLIMSKVDMYVAGIPTLVMIDEQGDLITVEGRPALNEDIDGQVRHT